MRGLSYHLAIACVAASACASVKTLPPRQAPPMAMPVVQLPTTPVPAGHGRVVIEATDGPMDVYAKTEGTFSASAPPRSGLLCRTPCVVDMPLGSYRLFFSGLAGDNARGDVAQLEVREGLNVLRRAPGKYEAPHSEPALGVTLGVSGSVMIGSGIYLAGTNESPAGGVALGVIGLGATIGGIVLASPSRAEEQAGATTAWNVSPQPAEASPPPEQEAPESIDLPATGSTAP